MTILFVILIVLASVILGLIILIQNPKGGGLAGNIAGFSNQFMGVKQTTDVLEKGTWVFGGVIAALCLLAAFFIPLTETRGGIDASKYENAAPASTPATPGTAPELNLPAGTETLDSNN